MITKQKLLLSYLGHKTATWILALGSLGVFASMFVDISPDTKNWRKAAAPAGIISLCVAAHFVNTKASSQKDLLHMIDGTNVLSMQNEILREAFPDEADYTDTLDLPTDRDMGSLIARDIMIALAKFSIPTEFLGIVEAARFYRIKLKPQIVKKANSVSVIKRKAEDLKVYANLANTPIITSMNGGITFDVERENPQIISHSDYIPDQRPDGLVPVAIGVDIENNLVVSDLGSDDPHIFAVGGTNSGKSTWVRLFLTTLLKWYTPDELQLVLIDKKITEMAVFDKVPHLFCPIVNDPLTFYEDALQTLSMVLDEANRRQAEFNRVDCKDLESYLEAGHSMTRVMLVIDEAPQLLGRVTKGSATYEYVSEAIDLVTKIAAIARSAGIYLAILSQRGVDSQVPNNIQNNLGTKVVLKTNSKKDGEHVFDEDFQTHNLLQHGDMMAKCGGKVQRLQTPFITVPEAREIVKASKTHLSPMTQKLKEYLLGLEPGSYDLRTIRQNIKTFRNDTIETLRNSAQILHDIGEIVRKDDMVFIGEHELELLPPSDEPPIIEKENETPIVLPLPDPRDYELSRDEIAIIWEIWEDNNKGKWKTIQEVWGVSRSGRAGSKAKAADEIIEDLISTNFRGLLTA